jgi:radical SAM protein with 4Fe4S-binding SPASM domain
VTRLNYHELNKIKQYVEGLGIEFKPNTMIYPRLDGSLEPCRFRLSPEEIITLNNTDGDCDEQIMTEEEAPLPTDNLFRCAAGISSFHINPYGELIFCTFMRKPSFDLKKGSFKEGFYSLYPEIRSAMYQTDSKCRDCEIFYLCSQCPALAELENGNQEKPIDYFCNLAHKLAACEK